MLESGDNITLILRKQAPVWIPDSNRKGRPAFYRLPDRFFVCVRLQSKQPMAVENLEQEFIREFLDC